MWGAITGQLATYAGELTNDLREIVAAGDEGAVSPAEGLSPRAQPRSIGKGNDDDDDLDAYVLDLERSLIRKRQEHEAALKEIDALQQRLDAMPPRSQTRDPDAISRLAKTEDENKALLGEVAKLHAAVAAKDAELASLNDQVASLVLQNQAIDQKLSQLQAETKVAHALHQTSLVLAMTTLSKVLPSGASPSEATTSLSSTVAEYATRAATRISSLEGDVKLLKNALHAFLLSHDARLDATATVADWTVAAKAKLDQLTQKMVADQDRAGRLEQQLSITSSKLAQTQKTLETHMLEHDALQDAFAATTAKAKEATAAASLVPEKDATIRTLQTKTKQLQRQNDQLTDEAAELADQLAQLKRVVHTQESSLQEEMHEKEEAAMDRLAELEHLVYSLNDELKTTKEAYALEQTQWIEHAQANASSLTEQETFELTTQLTLLQADKHIAEQDAERLQTELANAHTIFLQFEADRKREVQAYEAQIAALRAPAPAPTSEHEVDLKRVLGILEKKQVECDRLREALDRTAQHLGDDVDNIDKRMAIQMMIQFHESPNKHDVLEVIARILGCTEDDKERLLGNPLRLQLRSLGRLFHGASPDPPVDVAGKSFSDAWTEFLLDQVPSEK
ncbi:hypothetical protein SPRG_01932 [Saprolegnia parasitica CBS 223.65]|uniref:GRIP domain-containing protein n=1 Tax=Saprolegnia parasitica (strain CBS 223.65) TaxID=695850 RepID=A0A067CV44_SAPPC|nr:hypothetical protein SPRG_01932 [Saprolegnia parasitica CBS 223.65]KDO33120.1 hypothetical protein SPRG_01932 [Saprolegnia parasitica CBS 223.65]|eukprot:XP_012195887.1 hypothetical protein SPRG_01932 [Saprolegnia parasitica CBS 223.65]